MDLLITGGLALVPGPQGPEVRPADVGITDGKITMVGQMDPAAPKAARTISAAGKLVMPSLINAHTHAYMTLFRNCADDLLFDQWLFGRILPLEDKLEEEDGYWGAMLGIAEMIKSGTGAFLDMYPFIHATARAVQDSGIRAVLSRGLTGGADDVAGGKRRIQEALTELEVYGGLPRVSFMLAPHAPYTCDMGYMREIADLARDKGLGIHVHISESLSEVKQMQERYGMTPCQVVDAGGLLTGRTVAAHCVQLTAEDIQLLAERGVSVATNPVSNLKLANGVAPVPDLLQAGVNVCLGTDGASSNNTLNMFREMGFLALLHKGIRHDPLAVTARQALAIATENGARALGLDSGVLAVGRAGDLAILDLNQANLQPQNDLVAALAYSMTGGEVDTLIVDGQVLMEGRQLCTIDEERVRYEVGRICRRLGTWPMAETR